MMDWSGHMTAGGWIMSILWTMIIVGLLIALVVWLSSSVGRPDSRASAEGSGREILDRRLARGELTTEEYARLRDVLAEGSGASDPSPSRVAGAPG
jgi:uncharacterized membrane protein